jgi:hypothetical protein
MHKFGATLETSGGGLSGLKYRQNRHLGRHVPMLAGNQRETLSWPD